MKDEEARNIAETCSILSEPRRIMILSILTKGPRSVGELCRRLDMPQSVGSYHLGLLRQTGLATQKRDGRRMLYSLNKKAFSDLNKFLRTVK